MPIYRIPRPYGKITVHPLDGGVDGVYRFLLSDRLKKHQPGRIRDGFGEIIIRDIVLRKKRFGGNVEDCRPYTSVGGEAKLDLTFNTIWGDSYRGTVDFYNPLHNPRRHSVFPTYDVTLRHGRYDDKRRRSRPWFFFDEKTGISRNGEKIPMTSRRARRFKNVARAIIMQNPETFMKIIPGYDFSWGIPLKREKC